MKKIIEINGKQYRRISEGKVNAKFIKYRIYDKIADEINKVEPDDFNLRKFKSLERPLTQFIHREIKRDKKITSGDLRQAIDKSDFDDKVFGRSGIVDDWYKKSEKDFPKFMKKYTTYSDNPKKGWRNYNAGALTYGISKPLYKVLDSFFAEVDNLVPESVHDRRISEMTSRTKRDMENSFETSEDLDDFITKHQDSIPKSQWRKIDNYLDDIRDEEEGMKPSGWADPAKKGLKKILTRYIKESAKPKYEFLEFYQRFKR